nr:hypothetical protein [Tanacetum cinerariifolium]
MASISEVNSEETPLQTSMSSYYSLNSSYVMNGTFGPVTQEMVVQQSSACGGKRKRALSNTVILDDGSDINSQAALHTLLTNEKNKVLMILWPPSVQKVKNQIWWTFRFKSRVVAEKGTRQTFLL